jgi:hypothetical protein
MAAEHAGEAAAVECDALQHSAAFAHTDTAFPGHLGVPDGALGVDTDAVGRVAEVGPDPPTGEAAIDSDVEGGEAPRIGFGDDQGPVVRVTAMPFGKARPSATGRALPSGVTSAMIPGAKASPAMRSKPVPFT